MHTHKTLFIATDIISLRHIPQDNLIHSHTPSTYKIISLTSYMAELPKSQPKVPHNLTYLQRPTSSKV